MGHTATTITGVMRSNTRQSLLLDRGLLTASKSSYVDPGRILSADIIYRLLGYHGQTVHFVIAIRDDNRASIALNPAYAQIVQLFL